MFVLGNTLISNTVENTLLKAHTIANTASTALTISDMTTLYALYEADTTYAKVAEKFTNDTNALLAAKGGSIKATVSQLVKNVTGVLKSDTQIDALIAQYTQKGIDSWSKLYTFWITDTSDEIALSLPSAAISEGSALFPQSGAPRFSLKLSFDENTAVGTQVYNANADGGDSSVAYSLLSSSGIDHLPFSISATTGIVSFASMLNYELPVDLGANNSYDFTIRAANALGYADQNIQVTINDMAESATDTSLTPTPSQPASNSLTPSIAENCTTTAVLFDATFNADVGVTYSLVPNSSFVPSDSSLFNINSQTGKVTFKASPNYEAPLDIGANNIYNFTVRTITTATGIKATADQAVALTVTDVITGDTSPATTATTVPTAPTASVPPKGSVVDLGEYGKLIAPVQVNGNWYYAWDMNGDGVHNTAQSATGKYAANGAVQNASGTHRYAEDRASHDIIDAIFTKDINGANGFGNTTDTIRYASINNISLAMPTSGVPAGTVYIANNSNYTDVGEVWDTYNASNIANGTPPDWYANNYLTATPSTNGHEMIAVNGGYTLNAVDSTYGFVMLQVM